MNDINKINTRQRKVVSYSFHAGIKQPKAARFPATKSQRKFYTTKELA